MCHLKQCLHGLIRIRVWNVQLFVFPTSKLERWFCICCIQDIPLMWRILFYE